MPTEILAPGQIASTYNTDSKYVHIHNATSAVWQALNNLLRNNKVEHLYLEYSSTNNQDDLAQALFESNSLKSIVLKDMHFNGMSLAYMINVLAARHPSLTALTVRNYDSKELFPSPDGSIMEALANRFLNTFNDPCTLKSLQLEHICIDEKYDEHFAVFCDALAQTQTLTALSLVAVKLSEASIQKLKAALISNPSIKEFSVQDLDIEGRLSTALKDVVRKKPDEPLIPLACPDPLPIEEKDMPALSVSPTEAGEPSASIIHAASSSVTTSPSPFFKMGAPSGASALKSTDAQSKCSLQ